MRAIRKMRRRMGLTRRQFARMQYEHSHHNPSATTIVVLATGGLVEAYGWFTLPLIERYAKRCGYRFEVVTDNPCPGVHPAYGKLLSVQHAERHAIIWDADLVPLKHSPPIHEYLEGTLAAVWFEPTGMFRRRLRGRYGRVLGEQMLFNTGLVFVPYEYKESVAGLFGDFSHVAWDQGLFNHWVVTNNLPIQRLDPRFNCWIKRRLQPEHLRDNFCLHFARGTARKIGTLARLRENYADWLP